MTTLILRDGDRLSVYCEHNSCLHRRALRLYAAGAVAGYILTEQENSTVKERTTDEERNQQQGTDQRYEAWSD